MGQGWPRAPAADRPPACWSAPPEVEKPPFGGADGRRAADGGDV